MHLRHASRKLVALAVSTLLVLQLAACGTLIYPERRGQRSGEIDPLIAVLDGIGLLFFVVPGLVAFAIDFTTGAIYLPGGQKAKERIDRLKKKLDSRLDQREGFWVLHLEPQQLNAETVELVLREVAGESALSRGTVEVKVLGGSEEFAAEWALLQRPMLAQACY